MESLLHLNSEKARWFNADTGIEVMASSVIAQEGLVFKPGESSSDPSPLRQLIRQVEVSTNHEESIINVGGLFVISPSEVTTGDNDKYVFQIAPNRVTDFVSVVGNIPQRLKFQSDEPIEVARSSRLTLFSSSLASGGIGRTMAWSRQTPPEERKELQTLYDQTTSLLKEFSLHTWHVNGEFLLRMLGVRRQAA